MIIRKKNLNLYISLILDLNLHIFAIAFYYR